LPTHIISNLTLDGIDQDVKEWYSLNHHTAVAAREYRSSEREDEL
jgi:hypothetical protein